MILKDNMKKYIIIMGIFSFFSCEKKYNFDSEEFIRIEKQAKISRNKASGIYKNTFKQNFSFDKSPYEIDKYIEHIYIYNGFYYIGFSNKIDKDNNKLYFLAKINIETGEISVVK